MNNYIPETSAKFVKIDEEFTYSLDEGRVGILRNGSWLPRTQWDKAWTAAANELEQIRDEHHTMEELYNFRMLMHAHLAIMWHRFNMYPVVKSWRHHDGEECFDGNYFIVVAQLPTGQISNHYKKEFWGMFQIPNQEFAPKWDGHNSQDVLKRLTEELASLPIAIMNVGDNDTRS